MAKEDDELPLTDEDDAADASLPVRAFKPAEMVACVVCLRANPPTRMDCLYCGATLPAPPTGDDQRRPALRPLESWEQGFNVVLIRRATPDLNIALMMEAAPLLRIELGQLRALVQAQPPLPLARAATREEATLVDRKLRGLGWPVEVVPDAELRVETEAQKRIRKLELGAQEVKGWSSAESESSSAAWERVTLLVLGRIARKRVEVEERRGRRGAESEMVEAREFHEDESVLDLYFTDGVAGWRIMSENFDYSCLGAAKSLTAAENFKRLVETLRERARQARYEHSYAGVRHYLKYAWPLAEQTEAGTLRRVRPGRYNAEAVTSTTNETQFTRYGRLLQYFRLRELSTPS
ncbi:MAG TPA: hypothetical protein VGW12_16085 [Pyrinomonadaceae bacterium]|nr:hypothetical protein [Pyrinomonadaceae bacterium]